MDIVGVATALSEHPDPNRTLRIKPLDALEPTPEPYLALLCQPHGVIHASASRMGNADPGVVAPKYRRLLDESVRTRAQLVVTPEYSVPWVVVDDIVSGAVRPATGALWALGCESIAPHELSALRERLEASDDVRLVHEPLNQTKVAQRSFINPLVYVFWCLDSADRDVLCLLVQFKTVVSRDEGHVEVTSLYTGDRVYKFNADSGGIALIGLICSDAFGFTNQLVDDHYNRLLVLHIQLNQRPGHSDFSTYRQRLVQIASNSNTEVLCVNWAAGLAVDGGSQQPWNTISGSAVYCSPQTVRVEDGDVDSLHADGVYYSMVGKRWHGFFLHFGEHALLLRKQHVFANGPQAIVQLIPPQVVERLTWDKESMTWTPTRADDGFELFIQSYQPLGTVLQQLFSASPLAVERAIELLHGPTGQPQTWYTLSRLPALHVGEEESLRRITVSQEVDAARAGVAFRRERARLAQSAATIQNAAPKWPPAVVDLAGGFKFRWTSSDPHRNVEPADGAGTPATLVYLGENPEGDRLSNVHSMLVKALRVDAAQRCPLDGDVGAAVAAAVDRLCIAYKRGHELLFFRDPHQASITEPRGAVIDDIAGGAA